MDKPDFRTIGLNKWKKEYHGLDPEVWVGEMESYAIEYRDACEDTWNDYVIPLQSSLSEKNREIEELREALKLMAETHSDDRYKSDGAGYALGKAQAILEKK